MILAANTSTTPAGHWAIVAIAVAGLAFWLVMVVVVAARPEVKSRRQRWTRALGGQETTIPPGPVVGGTHVAYGGRSLGPRRDAPAMAMASPWTGADGEPEATERGAAAEAGDEPVVTRDDIPAVPRPRSSAPVGMTTSAGHPASTIPRPRTPRDRPDPGAQRTQGTAGPSVPAQRESATDQPARSRQGDRGRDQGRDRES